MIANWKLTPRQEQVARMLPNGTPDKEIGAALGIKTRCVRFHVMGILKALSAPNRTRAAVLIDRALRMEGQVSA